MNMEQIFWSPGVSLATIEKQVILKAYRFYRGNATQTAIALGVSEKTIRNKLQEYADDDKRQQEQKERDQENREFQLRRARGLVNTETGQSLVGSNTGFHVQPLVETPPKHAVPVPERKEVQDVLPSKASGHRESRRR